MMPRRPKATRSSERKRAGGLGRVGAAAARHGAAGRPARGEYDLDRVRAALAKTHPHLDLDVLPSQTPGHAERALTIGEADEVLLRDKETLYKELTRREEYRNMLVQQQQQAQNTGK